MTLKTRRMIVLRTDDLEGQWQPVLPPEVPEILKDPEMMGSLVDGNVAELSDGYFYRAEAQPLG